MSLSFYLFFCTYLFFFVLISSLITIFCPSCTSSSSFYGNFSFFLSRSRSNTSLHKHLLLLFPLMVKSLIHHSTNLHHKNHKNQNPQAWTPLTHKHRSHSPAPIHKHQNPFPSTHKHRSLSSTPIHKHPDPFPSTNEL